MAKLNLPCDEAAIRALRVGEEALLSGRMITGRDAAHHWLIGGFREEVAPYLAGSIIYHCGPVVRKNPDGSYTFLAAGPTTSAREEPYQADVIGRYKVRGVIGKGGMFAKTRQGLVDHGAVYLHAVGGTAQSLARAVVKVERVFQLEAFGVPEAMWVIEVKDFPTVVTMDAHGGSLHETIGDHSKAVLHKLLGGKSG
jgi:fumarate hydratase subunit beta